MKKKLKWLILIFVLFSVVFVSLKVISGGDPPNIIFISIDTLRQDHVGSYGYSKNITPVLDKIASEGVRFENSYSTAPWTLPSHMSMFTGLPPSVHKVDFDIKKLDERIKTFPEHLKGNGYHTGGIVSAIYLKKTYGYARGFDYYQHMYNKGVEKITDSGLKWITEQDDSPFFLFLHYFDAHWPYQPPTEYALKMGVNISEKRWRHYGRLNFLRKYSDPKIDMPPEIRKRVINLYDAEILRVDTNIGRIVEFLKKKGIYDNTVIVITSDHGEEFKEHGSFGHFHQLYSELINVPLIIRYPERFTAGLVPEVPVSSVDISGTLLSIADIPIPDQFNQYGFNLCEIVKNKKNSHKKRKLISETRKESSHHFSLISDNYKYITPYRYNPLRKKEVWIDVGRSLYNVKEDREDQQNLIETSLTKYLKFDVLKPSEKTVSEYIKKNIAAIRIIFFPGKDNKSEITGNISYKNIPELTSFGVGFNNTDRLSDGADGSSTDFRLTLEKDKKEIVIHLSTKLIEKKDFRITIQFNKENILERTINIKRLSKTMMLFKSEAGSVYIMKNGTLNKRAKPGLTKQEQALLKSLGYIN